VFYFVILIWCYGSMSCVVCESYGVQLRPAVNVLVVPYSVRLAMDCVGECVLCLQVHKGGYFHLQTYCNITKLI